MVEEYKGELELTHRQLLSYRVNLMCDQEGCDGIMVSDGTVSRNGISDNYYHTCDKCSHQVIVRKGYPCIEHR